MRPCTSRYHSHFYEVERRSSDEARRGSPPMVEKEHSALEEQQDLDSHQQTADLCKAIGWIRELCNRELPPLQSQKVQSMKVERHLTWSLPVLLTFCQSARLLRIFYMTEMRR